MAGAVVALLRVLRRPALYAALFTPILFSFSVGWGFVNYTLATAIAAWALVFVARAAIRPAALDVLAVGVLGVACAFAHVLAMLILCLGAAAIALEAAWRAAPAGNSPPLRLLRVLGRATLAALPLVIGCVYCIQVYREQYVWDPNMYRDPTLEGRGAPAAGRSSVVRRLLDGPVLGRDRPGHALGVHRGDGLGRSGSRWQGRRAGDVSREDPPPVASPVLA